ncbi:TauD/TfdA family dioxygenase [Komarekiella sp. 'clone 1']|uniref:TauD/TfdA family dioxygenase n=1 Tax=Komarekiella delphini-convector SJRDD-AB1 TaxID=2593771 RepID=A0AA40T0X7_9NOST|nr:TauD/TfdA family dioxygenase [Komarekiella delphini-convector]MBD6618565.1 TauD/TfdA family dioxygenase [Komarekiella delphini-convector SJRDD-AB1]
MKPTKTSNFNLQQKFHKGGRKSIHLETELIKLDKFGDEQTLPLIIKPSVSDVDIADWAEANREFVNTNLIKHGAILFKGFNITTAAAFERFGLAVCSELFNENGEHNRETVSGKVYTPVFYPADSKLLWHNENSFNYRWPVKILFGCSQPAQQGGETPIVDSRKVFQFIEPKVREQFVEKQVMYVRNYGNGLGLDWQTVFQTQNRADVEKFCQNNFIDFEWKNDGGLRTISIRPAVIKHPQTGEISWFNQAQHWHLACLDTQTRESLLSSFKKEDLPRNCFYGDGTPIEDSTMVDICEVYQRLEVCFPWQQGDILLLDNVLTAHGRNPYLGERKLFVAMSELISFSQT